MARKFDASVKHLIEAHSADWLAYAGFPITGPIQVVDADVSTVSPAADKVIRVGGPDPYIAHLEFQGGPDMKLDRRALFYKVLLGWRHNLPVRTVVFLLRPEADVGVKGGVNEVLSDDELLSFRYRVIRVWEQPPEFFLSGGLGLLPLAPISAVAKGSVEDIRAVLDKVRQKLKRKGTRKEKLDVWTITTLLLGLRYSRETTAELLKGMNMLMGIDLSESWAYQDILKKGEAKGMEKGLEKGMEKGLEKGLEKGKLHGIRELVLQQGKERFGPPSPKIRAAIKAIDDLDQMLSLGKRVLKASSWKNLLDDSK